MRLSMLLLLAGGVCAHAGIVTFEIVNSTSLSTMGGEFSGGGHYWGTFQLDTSGIPSTGTASFDLSSFDVFATGPVGNAEFSSAVVGDTGAVSIFTESILGEIAVQVDQFDLFVPGPSIDYRLSFDIVGPPGSFHGGVVSLATFQADLVQQPLETESIDESGSALVVDPQALAPEPSTIGLMAMGFLLLIARLRSQRTAQS